MSFEMDSTASAPLVSPAFTGTPTAPTAAVATSTTQLATTAFVQAALASDPGTTTNDAAAAGIVGEYIKTNVAVASHVSITTATAKTIASISLTAGDWDVRGTVAFDPSAGTLIVDMKGAISPTDNTLPVLSDTAALVDVPLAPSAGVGATVPVGTSRISLAAPATIYLVAQATFTVSTNFAYGFIAARRVR
jgi:hypothetical protein